MLSADQRSVFYISQSPGSAKIPFIRRSMAWVSVFTGEIRWYEHEFTTLANYKEIVLFDNSNDTIPGDEKVILLASHYQPRQQDYEAFVLFPIPWPQRGYGSDYLKGAIHISFRTDAEFDQIWQAPLPHGTPPTYPPTPVAQRMLEPTSSGGWCLHPEICTALLNSMAVLGELLRNFNEVIYKSYIEANPGD